jgi:hypothetical protein
MAERNIIEFRVGGIGVVAWPTCSEAKPTIFSNARRAVGGCMATTLAKYSTMMDR